MTLIGNSGQKIGDGSSAIQAGNDINIGNTTSEIVTICELVVASKMSSLKEEAMQVAMERAQEFGTNIAINIASNLDSKIEEKLKNPDIQYAISQAVVQAATKGMKDKNDLLQELIISKINNDDEDNDLIIDLALETTKRTTSNELKLLALVYYFRKCRKFINEEDIISIAEAEIDHNPSAKLNKSYCQEVLTALYSNPMIDFDKITNGINGIKPVDTGMMSIKGLIHDGKHFTTTYFTLLEKRTGVKLSNDQKSFEDNFKALNDILKSFGIGSLEDLNRIVLSPVGTVMAHDFLKARKFI